MFGAGMAHAQAGASARSPDPELDAEYEVDELVIEAAAQPRGSVIGDIPPEITLGPREIRSLGASSVADLLAALEPQLASGRGRGGGRPITLVNGARVSSFAEIRDLPPEAIVRVEILPEEVALRYGYRADQRVVNFVLRRRFNAVTTEVGLRVPTEGGRAAVDADVNSLRIQRDTRLQVDVKAARATSLLESERDLIDNSAATAGADLRPYRTLLPETSSLALNTVLARTLGEGVSMSLNGSLESTESRGMLGLGSTRVSVPAGSPYSPTGEALDVVRYDLARGALQRIGDGLSAHVGGSANGAVSGWRWTLTANADLGRTRSLTERGLGSDALQAAVNAGQADPFAPTPASLLVYRAPDRARSTVTSADAELLLNGTLAELPAGPLSAAFTIGAETLKSDSWSVRSGVRRDADLSRDVGRAKANLDLPLARRGGVLGRIGDLSLNANVAVDELSDFGTLTTFGGGVNWSPIEPVRIIASFTEEDGAPTVQQLGDPEIATPLVRVFDFTRGETVEVTQVSGGNPFLVADSRQVMKLGLTLRPLKDTDLVFRADYNRSRTEDLISAFPAATAEIEAAFPERFVRGADGRLLQVDVRPVNFARRDQEELRWGFNYSRPLRSTRGPGASQGPQQPAGDPAPPRPGGQAPTEGAERRAPGGGPVGRGFGGGRFGGGAIQFAAFHTWRLEDEILIRPGVPALDLLDGSALGQSGGEPRHQVDVQAGVSRNGLGARLTARWQEGTKVNGAAFGGQDLTFSDLTTVNLRLFADLGMQPFARGNRFLRGARVSLSVDNLFDERIRVRDAVGATPVSYQPDLVDPLGRTVRLSFRKVFF
ncbi:TonB-dependent receptor [Phenylobacterium kunshanense]|uniref:TonB-dependent receptor n=2 Tax=Phenylobacterium kunshanense TaxID=1445034 RepID=A0A328BI96_9CAUL|nr:TonB-dependent receptor [Phenylobacterium kunshanense]